MKTSKIIILVLVLVGFILLNCTLLKEQGLGGDVNCFQSWGNIALESGLPALYSQDHTDYGPVYLYVTLFDAWIQKSIFSNTNTLSSSYNFISKIINVICNLIIGVLLFLYWYKKDYKTALLAAIFYLFNLAVIYNTAFWGQADAFFTLLLFLSLLFALKNKYILSTIFLTLSIFTKIQGILLIPVICAVLVKNVKIRDWPKIIFSGIATTITILLPYIFAGVALKVINVVFFFSKVLGKFPWITANAYNAWYIVSYTGWLNGIDDSFQVFGISMKQIGLAVFALYGLMVFYQIIKNPSKTNIILGAASMALAFFVLPTQIHERYLFYFFALFSLIAVTNWRYLTIYLVLMVVHLFNLMRVLHFDLKTTIFYPIQFIFDKIVGWFSFDYVTVSVAVIHLIALIYLTKIGIGKDLLKNLKIDFLKLKKTLKKWRKSK